MRQEVGGGVSVPNAPPTLSLEERAIIGASLPMDPADDCHRMRNHPPSYSGSPIHISGWILLDQSTSGVSLAPGPESMRAYTRACVPASLLGYISVDLEWNFQHTCQWRLEEAAVS